MKKLALSRTRFQQHLDIEDEHMSEHIRDMLFNFFSNVYQELNDKLPEIKIKYIVQDSKLTDAISKEETTEVWLIITVEDKDLLVVMRSFWENHQELYHKISITSKATFNFEAADFLRLLIRLAVGNSELKGAYINIEDDDYLNFNEHELPQRSFKDIFLPSPLLRELRTYPAIFEKNGRLLRYLLAGNPGTGKTESVLAICNQLKAKGVTIIKADVTNIKSHIEFAEVLAPTLLVLDDLDLDLGDRRNNSHTDYLKDFLDILDGVEKVSKEVGILATTNSIHLIDLAAQRPGRFHRIISMEGLTAKSIEGIIQKAMSNMEIKSNPFVMTEEIIGLYQEKGLNGSYIYNLTQMLLEQIEIGEIGNEHSSILEAIRFDLDNLEKIKNSKYLE